MENTNFKIENMVRPFWHDLLSWNSAIIDEFDRIWPYSAAFGKIWPYLPVPARTRPELAILGLICPYLSALCCICPYFAQLYSIFHRCQEALQGLQVLNFPQKLVFSSIYRQRRHQIHYSLVKKVETLMSKTFKIQ